MKFKYKGREKEYKREYMREHRKKYKDYFKKYNKKYRAEHRDELKVYHKKYMKKYYNDYRDKYWSKKHDLEKRYKLNITDYNNMLLAQNNRCAICNEPLDFSDPHYVCVDHNHQTGKVRGILCRSCNLALGYLKDNPVNLINALDYLKKYRSETDKFER